MEWLENLKKEYATQDNRSTAFPIYVSVQEKFCVGIIADGYSVSCPFGDGETITKYGHPDFMEDSFDNKDALVKVLKEEGRENEVDDIIDYQLGYIWHPVEFFLTIKGAEEYMKANAHNHGKLRTYVHHFERRNFEMRTLLKELGFKTET